MMNNSKTSKAWRWKVATFLPLLALLLMAFGHKKENAPAKDSEEIEAVSPEIKETIMGTWELTLFNYQGDSLMLARDPDIQCIKVIKDSTFSWDHYYTKTKHIVDFGRGSYQLSNDSYIETIKDGGNSIGNIIGQKQFYKIKLEKDKMYLSGTMSDGTKIKEIWKRVGTKSTL